MMSVKEIKEWLKDMPDTHHIGVDEGGLCLVGIESRSTTEYDHVFYENYCEIGGVPEEEEPRGMRE